MMLALLRTSAYIGLDMNPKHDVLGADIGEDR
jgi:hypothetical protein